MKLTTRVMWAYCCVTLLGPPRCILFVLTKLFIETPIYSERRAFSSKLWYFIPLCVTSYTIFPASENCYAGFALLKNSVGNGKHLSFDMSKTTVVIYNSAWLYEIYNHALWKLLANELPPLGSCDFRIAIILFITIVHYAISVLLSSRRSPVIYKIRDRQVEYFINYRTSSRRQ